MTDTNSIKDISAQALQDLYANLTQGKEFVLAQAPDICQQIIAWQIAKGAVVAIAFLTVIIGSVFLIRWAYRTQKRDELDVLFTGVACTMCTVFTFTIFICEGASALKALIAPKLFILEYITAMIGKMS